MNSLSKFFFRPYAPPLFNINITTYRYKLVYVYRYRINSTIPWDRKICRNSLPAVLLVLLVISTLEVLYHGYRYTRRYIPVVDRTKRYDRIRTTIVRRNSTIVYLIHVPGTIRVKIKVLHYK